MQLEITRTDDGYRLEGELDMATAGDLSELFRAPASDEPLVLDFSGVSFMDSSGLRALLEGAGLPNGGGPVVSSTPHRRCAASSTSPSRAGVPGWRSVPERPPTLARRVVVRRRRLHDMVRRVVDRRNGSQSPGLIVLERLNELLTRVHHERAVPGDRLADRAAAEHQHLEGR